MCASPFDFLRSGPPPPRVVLLPDSVFFSRSIEVAASATEDEVAGQVGLALEGLSPFPLNQLYFGYYRPPGADRALAYACYRRRFTADQLSEWSGAEQVIPSFAAVVGLAPEPGTTALLTTEAGLTAVRWDKGPVPVAVGHEPLAADASEEDRSRARERVLRTVGQSGRVLELSGSLAPQSRRSDREIVFLAGDAVSRLPKEALAAMDVRDRGELAALARAHRRDTVLWRTTLGALLACLVLALGEAGLFGAGLWQSARLARAGAQRAPVARIMDEQQLANRIDDLSTKRLLPLEMISIISPEVLMPSNTPAVQFLRATTSGLYTLQVEAQTSNAGEIAGYRSAIERSPACDHVEIRDQRARDNVVSFTLVVTFKPAALAPASS